MKCLNFPPKCAEALPRGTHPLRPDKAVFTQSSRDLLCNLKALGIHPPEIRRGEGAPGSRQNCRRVSPLPPRPIQLLPEIRGDEPRETVDSGETH